MSSFDAVAAAYRDSFATLCAGPLERLLTDTPDGSHLDVGCGTGTLAHRAAALGRSVVAVDSDADMVAMSKGLVPGPVVEASLPDLPFEDDSFDAVTANFVVNHVADPRAGISELGRVTRPGGRIAVTSWLAQPAGWAVLVGEAFSAAGVVPLPSQHLSPELDFERSVDGLRGLAEFAGLEVVVATELSWVWETSADALWGGVRGGVARIGQTYVAQPPDVQRAAERAFRAAAAELAPDGLLRLASTAAYVVAARPV